MLHGRFGDTTGRPYLEGRLIVPAQGVNGDISFLVDTGADTTTLMPADSRQMGLDYRRLTRRSETVGIGGLSQNYLEHATLVFLDPRRYLYVYFVDVLVAQSTPDIEKLPSLLGRNVLDRWRMVYDPGGKRLSFRPHSWDQRIAVR